MEATSLIPAAQYVRMSTEDQQYSIANQKAAIQIYAEKHGFMVTSTYSDAGKSGVEIKCRKELRRLLSDVMRGRAQYKAILVYDVSRWGRFQDVDEAAHYEFLCKSAGVPVRYCAEQFDNDGSLPNSILKAIKRTMAAEYSRELGVRVSEGQRRIALLGFRVVGTAGYGLRRMMVSPDGKRRIILQDGERKAIHTDRVILVPGPEKEVACVRKMFSLASEGKTPRQIAKELSMSQMVPPNARSWGRVFVYRILTNEKYVGCNIYGKTQQRLSSASQAVERRFWSRHPNSFVPIIDLKIFDRVQRFLKKRGAHPERSDAFLIREMKKILARDGKLTHRILKKKGILASRDYKRVGSVMKAYEMAGYRPPSSSIKVSIAQIGLRLLRKNLYIRLKQLFGDRVRFVSLPGQQMKLVVEIDGRLRVAVYLCRTFSGKKEKGWLLRLRALDAHLPALICTVDQSFSELLNFYVVSPPGNSLKSRKFRESQPWLSAGRKLGRLEELCEVANDVASHSKNCEGYTVIDDTLIATDTWTITLGNREILLGPIGSPIFNLLIQNAGQVVSRDRLRRTVPKLTDSNNLDAHIYLLRVKLGVAGQRIQTVRGVGFMYVKPDKVSNAGPNDL